MFRGTDDTSIDPERNSVQKAYVRIYGPRDEFYPGRHACELLTPDDEPERQGRKRDLEAGEEVEVFGQRRRIY